MNLAMLSELFGGATRYRALKYIFENPTRHFGARELAAEANIDPANTSRWLRRWAECGLLERTVVLGRPRFAASKDVALQPLILLFQQSGELSTALKERLSEIGDRIDVAAIFGSVASGTATEGSDIDLLLLTEMSRLELQAFFKPVGRKIGRPVNVMTYSLEEWSKALADNNPLVRDIRDGAKIILKGNLNGIT